MTSWEIAFTGGRPAVPVILGTLLAVGLALLLYRAKRAALPRLSFVALASLRALAVVIVGLFLLQPVLRLTHVETRRTKVAVLLDVSGSMRVPDAAGDASRLEAAVSVLDGGPADLLRRLRSTHDVRVFTFGAVTTALAEDADLRSLRPGEHATALGDALLAATRELGAEDLSAIVPLTDGVVTGGEEPGQAAAAQAGVPIFPVAVGGGGPFADVGIASLPGLPSFTVGNEATIKADLSHVGLGGLAAADRRLELALREGEEVLVSRTVEFPAEDGLLPVELTFVPRRPGSVRLRLGVQSLKDELVTENNARTFSVRVTDPHIRVLIVEGVARQEYRYLRRVLESDPNIELTGVVKVTGRRYFLQGADAGVDLSRGLPATQEAFGKFDAVILGDIGREEFTASQLDDLRAFVDAGGALLVLGGYHAFGAGGYAASPLADLLPVTMGGESDGHVEQSFRLVLTDLGRDHLVFRGCEEFFDGADAPGRLDGANRVTGAKHGADVLAAHPAERAGGRPMPVVAVHRYGAGRVMAFTADTTWKWKFRMAARGLDSPYYRFWRQSIRWLVSAEEDEEAAVESERVAAWTPQFAYGPDRHVALRARVKSGDGSPETGATVDVTVRYPVPVPRPQGRGADAVEESMTVRLMPDPQVQGEYEKLWLPPVPGLYQATARAQLGGRDLGAARFEFAVGLAVSAWTTRPQYDVGRPVVLRARVRGKGREPLAGARVTAEIEYPFPVQREGVHGRLLTEEGTTVEFSELPDSPGEHQVTWRPLVPGLYRATVTARDAEGGQGSYLLEFVVGSSAPEFHRLDVDQDVLRLLARTTRGRAHTLATAASIPDELARRRTRQFRRQEITLWNAPWFFAAFLACLTCEWLLRKRRALN